MNDPSEVYRPGQPVRPLVLLLRSVADALLTEAGLQRIVEETPFAICVLRGVEFVMEMANEPLCRMWGRSAEQVIGKPLFEALPEAAGEGFDKLLTSVYETGIAHRVHELPATLFRNGQLDTVYFDFVYEPLHKTDGSIDRIMVVATDATRSRQHRHTVEINQNRLQMAVETAELGTWDYNPATGVVVCSDRMADWLGLLPGQSHTLPMVLAAVADWDRQRVADAVAYALTPGSGGVYDSECHLVNLIDGRPRTVRAKGRAFFDEAGVPYWFIVTVLDITEQKRAETDLRTSEARYRDLSVELDQRVKLRTRDLERSNLDLMQFASVASHDLKEPLRKVQTFATRLEGMLAGRLYAEERDMFRRLINATERMNTLVGDVLRLSVLADQTVRSAPENLNAVINRIREDLELLIGERRAEVTNGPLPTVSAMPGQMHQLFQNLVSNALKFNTNPVPRIRIERTPLTEDLMRTFLLPTPNYVVIAVMDNGIGFDQKYADKVFVMFQRLHGRSQYAGTGIGLTIVKKIIDGHHGFIDVQSGLGQGTTFRVVLPMADYPDYHAG
ncbi:MAG: PAS domain-containing protein [Bacteroidetes bacterium]|nr:PAS domain-containing protein [Fibrella sp.]